MPKKSVGKGGAVWRGDRGRIDSENAAKGRDFNLPLATHESSRGEDNTFTHVGRGERD